ncbi:MAG: T9SS type A sorting domain-containing protein [Chitinophagales bacterium]
MKKYICAVVLIFCGYFVEAQTGFYIPQSGKVFFNGDTATIFSNVINRGNLGVGKNAFVNFTGKTWNNDPQSLITDESSSGNGVIGTGGWIRFLSDSIRQQIDGGYNAAIKAGPSFPNLIIQNTFGVELSQSNAKVRRQFNFSNGLMYLQDYIFVVGDRDPGRITGYDSLRYFVTNNKPGSGLLIREHIRRSDGQIVFPIGSKINSYTPAAILSNSLQSDDYYANVFDSVRSSLFTGTYLSNESVNKTWEIGKISSPSDDNVSVTLQHIYNDEGSLFKANRQYAYVSRFNGTAWDTAYPQSFPGPGFITTGTALTNSGTNTRILNSFPASSYFTKLTGSPIKKTNLWFNAYRLDTANVYTYWKTNPELNIKLFVVQRMLSNETGFEDVATVPSKTALGYSYVELDYSAIDPNNYQGISFYRLLMLSYAGDSTYSDTVAVGNKPGPNKIMIWPNPAPNVFYVSINKTLPAKAIVVWNVLGQKLREEYTNGRTTIQMGGLIPGTYFVGIVLTSGNIIETKKLVVIGH